MTKVDICGDPSLRGTAQLVAESLVAGYDRQPGWHLRIAQTGQSGGWRWCESERVIETNDEAREDDRLGLLAAQSEIIGDELRRWTEQQVAAVFLAAFSGSAHTSDDGLPLCHAARGNCTDLAPSVHAVADAARRWPANSGQLLLLSHYGYQVLRADAQRLELQSQWERLERGGCDPTPAPADSQPPRVEVVICPWLVGQSWFLVNPAIARILLHEPEPIRLRAARDERRATDRFTVSRRVAVGFNDWRGVFGSTGTAAQRS